jgi:hypothetical protein
MGIDAGPGVDAGPPPACVVDGDCGGVTYGGWSACGGYADQCDESGERTRAVHRPRCAASSCSTVDSTETDTSGCGRDQSAVVCMPPQRSSWGPCGGFSGTCGEDGTQDRSVSRYRCRSGSCQVTGVDTETQGCSRGSRDGVVCGTTTYCGSSGSCRICSGGACVVNTPHFNGACNPSCGVAGALCGVSPTRCDTGTCPGGTAGPGGWADTPQCCAGACLP